MKEIRLTDNEARRMYFGEIEDDRMHVAEDYDEMGDIEEPCVLSDPRQDAVMVVNRIVEALSRRWD